MGLGRFLSGCLLALAALVAWFAAAGFPSLPGLAPQPSALPAELPPASGAHADAAAEAPRPSQAQGSPKPESTPPRDKPLRGLLASLARSAGLALVLEPGVDGALVAESDQSVAWQTRLDAYARVGDFVYRLGPDLLEVRRPRDRERAGKLSRTQAAASLPHPGPRSDVAEGSKNTLPSDVPSPLPTLQPTMAPAPLEPPTVVKRTEILSFQYAEAASLVPVLKASADKGGARVAAAGAGNALVFSGPEPEVLRLLAVARALDRPRRRVLLEARIVELSRTAREELGVEWTLDGELGAEVRLGPGSGSAEGGALLVATKGASPLEARLSALESEGRVRVVSRPSVAVLEGSTATIESVRILRIRLPDRGAVLTEQPAGAAAGRATEEVPVGVRLEVTPSLRAHDKVHLQIQAKSSSLGPPLPPDGIPEELSRTIAAEIEVQAGRTAVLGGLRREGKSRVRAGVPILRSIPGLGLLFGKKEKEVDHEELLILVRPRLLEPEPNPPDPTLP